MNVKTWLADHWEMAIPLVVGACIGWAAHPSVKTVTVEKKAEVTMDESRGLDLTKHEVKVKEPKVKTRIIYRDGPVRERIVERSGPTVTTKDEEVKVRDDVHVVERITEKSVTSAEGRWSARLNAGGDSEGRALAGVAADYRILGPLTVGGWVLGGGRIATGTATKPYIAGGGSLGLRF